MSFVSDDILHPSDWARMLAVSLRTDYDGLECGGTIDLSEETSYISTISSPAFPLDYTHNLDCVWNVTAPTDRIISVK